MATRKQADVLQLKVTLDGVSPPVWRRLLVPNTITLGNLHDVLQEAMGWTNSHLHCFEVGDRRIGMVGVEEDAKDLEDERRIRLATLLQRKGDELVYRYDYGDDWEHRVVLEAALPFDRRFAYPLCTGGARACPPEDSGGPGGYEELLCTLASPKAPGHDDAVTWVGGYFDSESFDANAVNEALRGG